MVEDAIKVGDVEIGKDTLERLITMFEERGYGEGSGRGFVYANCVLRDDGFDGSDVNLIDLDGGNEQIIPLDNLKEKLADPLEEFEEAFKEAAPHLEDAFVAEADEDRDDGNVYAYGHAHRYYKNEKQSTNVKESGTVLDVNGVGGRELRYYGVVHEDGYDRYPGLNPDENEGTWFWFLYGE